MTEDARGFIALQDQITRLSQRLRLVEKHTTMPAEEPAENKDLQGALAKKSHVIAKQDEKIKSLRNRLDEKDALIEGQAWTIKNQAQKLSLIHKALQYKGNVHPQVHLDQVRRTAGVPARPTRRFR